MNSASASLDEPHDTTLRTWNIGVIALVPDLWKSFWQPRHQVLMRLSRYFQVVWVTPAHHWQEAASRFRNGEPVVKSAAESTGLTIYQPEFWLPTFYRPQWLAEGTSRLRLKRARDVLVSRGSQKIVLYLWRPEFAYALSAAAFDLSCYHIDDEYSFSPVETALDQKETRLIAAVDQVFIHSPGLLRKKGKINPHTTYVPNGVDYQAFSTAAPEPSDLASIPRPRIGYTGWIKRQLDFPLLLQLSKRHPDWSFIFVGPQKDSHPEIIPWIRNLRSLPNVHFLGGKSTQELCAYPQHFDVCMMPYVVNDYTNCIYPLKLHEYLATGRPVIGTKIRSLDEFSEVVALASVPDEWSAAISTTLNRAASDIGSRAARQAVARQYDWDNLVRQIAATIAGRVASAF